MALIKDLDKETIIEELRKEESKIETLKKKITSLDSELQMSYFRRNEIWQEIANRYERGIK